MKNIKNYIVAIFYSFRQSTKVLFPKNWEMSANLDPFYLFGIKHIIKNLKNIKKMRKLLLYVLPLIIYSVFQIIILEHIDILRLLINCCKIVICICILLYVKENYNKVSVYKIIKISTFLLFLVTLLSLFLKENTIFWRFNDIVNKYNETRLHGLFLEPSELGFHVMLLIIFLFGYYFVSESTKQKKEIIFLIIINLITIYFSRPFGAIVIGIISLVLILIYNLYLNFDKKKLLIYFIVMIVGMVLVFILYKNNNPIIMRFIDTISGNDASNYYRIEVSFNVLKNSFIDYKGVGYGFGNLNTSDFSSQYNVLGLATVVANSFQYFIIEGGIFSIIFLVVLILKIVKKVLKSNSHVKFGIMIFIMLYQIFGGHFTSGLTWALYGLCLSDFNEEEEL